MSLTNSFFWNCLYGVLFLLEASAIVYYVSSNFLARKKQEHEEGLEKVEEDQFWNIILLSNWFLNWQPKDSSLNYFIRLKKVAQNDIDEMEIYTKV